MPRPIFIIGSPRSGTSVLTWALGQHPNISLQPESNWMPGVVEGVGAAYRIGTSRGKFSQISNAEMPFESFVAHFGNAIDAISRECFERRVESFSSGFRDRAKTPKHDPAKGARLIYSPKDPKQRWVDGTPEYTFSTYELSLLFPDCQFIHILRRPDQVVNSLVHFKNAGSDGQNFSVSTALDIWMRHTLAAQEAAKLFGRSRLIRIDNADLASDGNKVLQSCFEFLGEADCEHATSALNAKMNSSKATERQDATSLQVENRADFKKAKALYKELRVAEVPAEPDPDVLAKQQERLDMPEGYVTSVLKAMLNR